MKAVSIVLALACVVIIGCETTAAVDCNDEDPITVDHYRIPVSPSIWYDALNKHKTHQVEFTMESMFSYEGQCEFWSVDLLARVHRYVVNCSNHGQAFVPMDDEWEVGYRLTANPRRALSWMIDEILYTTGYEIGGHGVQFVRQSTLQYISDKLDDFIVRVAEPDGFTKIPNCDDGCPYTDDSYDGEHGCIHAYPGSEELGRFCP